MGHNVNSSFLPFNGVLHHDCLLHRLSSPVTKSPQPSTETITLISSASSTYCPKLSRLFNINKTLIFFCKKVPTLLNMVSERSQVVA